MANRKGTAMNEVRFRQINRLRMHLPLRVIRRNDWVQTGPTMWQARPEARPEVEYTVTENICSEGCYFFLSQEPPLGSHLEMEITIPGEVHDIPFAKIYCRGEVVRVDRCTAEAEPEQPQFGVAARIERFPEISVESIPRPADHAAGEAIA